MPAFSRFQTSEKVKSQKGGKKKTSSFNSRRILIVFTKLVNFFLTGGLISGIRLSTIFSTSLSCDSFEFSAFEATSSNDLMRMVDHGVSSE